MLQRLLLATTTLSTIFAQLRYIFQHITINDHHYWLLDIGGGGLRKHTYMQVLPSLIGCGLFTAGEIVQ